MEKDFQSNNSEDAPFRDEEEEQLGLYKTLFPQETNKKQKIDTPNPSEDSSKKSTKLTKENSDSIENNEKSNINSSSENNSEISIKNEIISSPLFPFQNSIICEKNNSFLGKKTKDSGNCKEKQSEIERKTFGCDEIKNNLNQEKEKKGISPKENFGDEDDILNPNEINYESNIKDCFLEEEEKNFLAFKEKQNAFIAQSDEREKKSNIPYFYFINFDDHFQVLPFKNNSQ